MQTERRTGNNYSVDSVESLATPTSSGMVNDKSLFTSVTIRVIKGERQRHNRS